MSDTDRLGEAIAISRAKYGPRKRATNWTAAFIAAGLTLAIIAAIAIALMLS